MNENTSSSSSMTYEADDDSYIENYDYEVVVIGSGTAGLVAGLRSAELGRSVAVLEKAPQEHQGGHTRFSESFRTPSAETNLDQYGYQFAVDDYTETQFRNDIVEQTNGRGDDELIDTLVEKAGPTIEWLTAAGVDWRMDPLAVGYTAARTWFDGEEYVETLTDTAESAGADFYYGTAASDLHRGSTGQIVGLTAHGPDGRIRFTTNRVILAAGDYGSSDEQRVRYYGSDFDAMKVRGSRYNTGEALSMAEEVGAQLVGQWGGAHMALIDAGAPDVEGGANRVDGYQYGLIVNDNGERFVDEGEDARAHTYAKFGRLIFDEPDHIAYIILDERTHDLVRATGPSDPVIADDVETVLAEAGCDNPEQGAQTVREYNTACDPGEFEPEILDGNKVESISPPKSNWAVSLNDPPYYVYKVTGGITFSFGGVKINTDAKVIDKRGSVIPGLYAAGNSTGELFYDNYPGGTAQMNAAVYGKIAAESANDDWC